MSRRLLVMAILVAGVLSVIPASGLARSGPAGTGSSLARPGALAFGNGYESQLACASATQCTAVEIGGAALTFNPIGAGAVTHTKPMAATGTNTVLCPSTTSCVEADGAGHIAVFAPRRTAAKAATFTVGGSQGLQSSVACPSASSCVAETFTGEAVFDPHHLRSPKTTTITANGMGGYVSLSCPSTQLCVTSNGTDANLASFAPHAAAQATTHVPTSVTEIGPLDCTSRSFCVALGAGKGVGSAQNTVFFSFDPAHPGNPRATPIKASALLSVGTFDFLTCESATLCAAAGGNPGVIVFDPHRSGNVRYTGIPSGQEVAGIAFAGHSLVLLSSSGNKAVINPSAPPKMVTLAGLSKAAKVAAS